MFFDSLPFSHLSLLNHPFYQAWTEGRLKPSTLKEYALQYHHHVERFPRYIGAIHSQCESPPNRKVLLQNLLEEEGYNGTPHPQLWKEFAYGLGVDKESFDHFTPSPAIQKVVECFFRLARSSYAEGLGALYAYEAQVPEIAKVKMESLKQHFDIKDDSTLAFFKIHQEADVFHREALEALLKELPVKEKALALTAAQEASQNLWNFLSEMQNYEDRT